ncbi:MAG: MBL fold metallo-hydrolase [Halodesulfurarchaeum sp.]|nr:MBL fold metallo-hydrolase [Halodesulfurarchaeum sp.]
MPRALSEDIWLLELGYVNAYLVRDDVLVLFDAGLPWSGRRIRAEIERAGFDPAAVKRVLLTHYDLDHVGALSALPGRPKIHAGEPDAAFVAGTRRPGFDSLKRGSQHLGAFVTRPPASSVRPIEDGEKFGSFTAIHSPGHTMGHVVYASEKHEVAFIGDLAMSDGESLSLPPWFFNEDGDRLADSIETVAERLPPVSLLAPGHGEPLWGDATQILRGADPRQSVTGDTPWRI